MPCTPAAIGSVWASGSWSDTAWCENTWAGAVVREPQGGGHPVRRMPPSFDILDEDEEELMIIIMETLLNE